MTASLQRSNNGRVLNVFILKTFKLLNYSIKTLKLVPATIHAPPLSTLMFILNRYRQLVV